MKKIKNLIFDLGGVILNINPQLTLDAFSKMGMDKILGGEAKKYQVNMLHGIEKGATSPQIFRNNVRDILGNNVSDEAIDKAWTAMIINLPQERIKYLEELKKSYRIFLLSNTNEIHRILFHRMFKEGHGYSFYDLFEKNYYSHEMGLRKPDPEIYRIVLKDNNLTPEETLFIDDLKENTESAESLGMQALLIEPGTMMERLPTVLASHHYLS
jgi:putative hydrolase of the HAD superfamily